MTELRHNDAHLLYKNGKNSETYCATALVSYS